MLHLALLLLLAFRHGPDVKLVEIVEEAAGRQDWTILVAAEHDDFWRARTDAPFEMTVPRERMFDLVRAILAFYEYDFKRLGEGDLYAVLPARDTGVFIKDRTKRVESTVRFRLLDAGGVTTLALPVASSHAFGIEPRPLPAATRNRLLHALEGLHAGGRAAAARILGAFGSLDAEVKAALEQSLEDEDPGVREAARKALCG